MSVKHIAAKALHGLRIGLASVALFQFTIGASLAGAAPKKAGAGDANTASPIKHVIVIVGENRSFDHIFATYTPKPGETCKQPAFGRNCHGQGRAWHEFRASQSVFGH